MPTATRTFRVFVSSTFEDLKAERDALQREVFPRLRRLCEENNARFQTIDLRWGVRDEAALDQQTMEICLREIERCQQTGIKPNFIVLLGDRYGWRPLPARIEAGEFETVQGGIANADDRTLVASRFQRDDNAAPPEYVLKPRTGEWVEAERWQTLEARLHKILLDAAHGAAPSAAALVKYEASATHQEILRGLGQSEEDRKHVFAFFRTSAAGTTEDPDLGALKLDLREKLPAENIHPFSAADFSKLCADVEASLSAVIKAETGRFTSRPALDLESEAHDVFALGCVRHFTGRQRVLATIGDHIRRGESRPLVVHGPSGCGKSAIMAKAAVRATAAVPDDAVLIQRFIGVTPDSSSGFTLLSSVCQQLSREYGVSEETPIGFQPLVVAFHDRMARATAERPLVLFLDALDQLRSDDEARSFTWLRQNLPPHVSLVVSTTEIPAGLTSAAQVTVEDFPAKEAEQVLAAWLADAKRELQSEQRQKVLDGFAQSKLPLYLKLAFEEARRWRSFDAADGCLIGSDVGAMIDLLFARLSAETNHGPILVNRSLGFLAAARYGLTEDEMLDVLAEDDAVWSDFDQRKRHDVSERRLPVVVWSRLSLDLEPYFTERAAPGGKVVSFFHRQLAERVAMRFLAGTETQARHSDLARHFSKKPAWFDEGRKVPNARKAAELVYQQLGARQWTEAAATLLDCQFLFAKVAAGMVLDLDDDYQSLLQDAPKSELRSRDVLRQIQGTLRLRLYLVANDAAQFFSQMRGRLVPHQAQPGIAAFLKDLDAFALRPRLRPLWPTLEASGGPVLQVLEGHTASVNAVALSADGKRAVSGSGNSLGGPGDNTVRVWDLAGNQPPRILEGHTDSVWAVALSADGKRAVSGSHDRTLRVWDLAGNQPPRILEGHTDSVLAVALSADGKRAVSGSGDNTLHVWDLEGNQLLRVLEGHTNSVLAVALSADGARAVSGSCDETVRVWDLEGNQPPRILTGHMMGSVAAVALSADGKRAAAGSHDDMLRVWDLESDQPPRILHGNTNKVHSLALSADGRRVVAGTRYKTLRVWNLEDDQPSRVMEGHTGWVCAVALSADGKRAVSGSNDKTLRVWDLEGGQPPRLLEGHNGKVSTMSLSTDGKRAVSGSDDCTLRLWDLEGNQPPRILEDNMKDVRAVAMSGDGKGAVSSSCDYTDGYINETVRIWDLESNRPPRVLKGQKRLVYAVALSANGKRAVSGSSDSALRVWDLEHNRPPRVLEGHTGPVSAVALSGNGKHVVSGSWDHTVRVWDLEGNQLPRVLEGHTDVVHAVAISADGKRAVSGSNDKTLRVWDLEGDQPPRFLEGHTNWVYAVALSSDGKRAVSGSWDYTARVWDLESGKCLAIFTFDAKVHSCAWARGRIMAGDESGQVHLFAWEE